MRSDWSLRPRTSLFVPLAVALALAGGTGLSATAPTAEPDPHQVLARVDGKPITQGDFEKAASAELLQLEREYTQARRTLVEAKLKQMARDAMVATEAKAKGVNPEQLIADAAKLAPVTDAEVGDQLLGVHPLRLRLGCDHGVPRHLLQLGLDQSAAGLGVLPLELKELGARRLLEVALGDRLAVDPGQDLVGIGLRCRGRGREA